MNFAVDEYYPSGMVHPKFYFGRILTITGWYVLFMQLSVQHSRYILAQYERNKVTTRIYLGVPAWMPDKKNK